MELGLSNFMMFFIVIGAGLIFVFAWIIRSEARINAAKSEIVKLNTDITLYEREKFALLEKVSALQDGKTIPSGTDSGISTADSLLSKDLRFKNEALNEENNKLKKELDEAKRSLEEVYKALSSQE